MIIAAAPVFATPDTSPAAAVEIKRGQQELAAVFHQLVAMHGFKKAVLACHIANAENIIGRMQGHDVPAFIVEASRYTFESLLTALGNAYRIEQQELEPIVRGLREHMGILDADVRQARGDSDGRQS